MNSKRQGERLSGPHPEPETATPIPPHHRAPGQPGYPQARAIERLRHQYVTRVRKLGLK
jgi:hypothetical protein